MKKKIGELKGMSNNLARDMTEADRSKVSLLSEREELVKMITYSEEKRCGDKMRERAVASLEELNFERK